MSRGPVHRCRPLPSDQNVGDLLSLTGPAGDGASGAVLEVVWVRHDGDGPGPVLGEGVHILHRTNSRVPEDPVTPDRR